MKIIKSLAIAESTVSLSAFLLLLGITLNFSLANQRAFAEEKPSQTEESQTISQDEHQGHESHRDQQTEEQKETNHENHQS